MRDLVGRSYAMLCREIWGNSLFGYSPNSWEQRAFIDALMHKVLTGQQRQAIILRFGLHNGHVKSPQEVSKQFRKLDGTIGCTVAHVYNLLRIGLARLRNFTHPLSYCPDIQVEEGELTQLPLPLSNIYS